jgi:glutamate 5-kinase
VLIRSVDGKVVGRGLIECDHVDAQQMIGLKSQDIIQRLGPNIRTELIHRDNLALEQTSDLS